MPEVASPSKQKLPGSPAGPDKARLLAPFFIQTKIAASAPSASQVAHCYQRSRNSCALVYNNFM